MPVRDDESEAPDEAGTLVGRLLKRGVGAPTAALGYLGEQFAGWKTEFMSIFQSEIRRFLDRVNPAEEMHRLIEGKKLQITMSVKLVDDESAPRGKSRSPERETPHEPKAAKPKSGAKKKKR